MGQWVYTDWKYQPPVEDKDYAVKVSQSASDPRFTESPDNGGYKKAAANAVLINQAGEGLEITLTDVGIMFSASGRTLQSRTYRQFIFHNFAPVALNLAGQCRSQAELGKLAEFTYQSHRLAVSSTSVVDTPLITLIVQPGGYDTVRGHKGRHKGIAVEGHIEGFVRRHERWVNAPPFQFTFLVENWLLGIDKSLHDDADQGKILKTVMGYMNSNETYAGEGGSLFVGNPDATPVTPNEGGHSHIPQTAAEDTFGPSPGGGAVTWIDNP